VSDRKQLEDAGFITSIVFGSINAGVTFAIIGAVVSGGGVRRVAMPNSEISISTIAICIIIITTTSTVFN
jgi:hypothetical protein